MEWFQKIVSTKRWNLELKQCGLPPPIGAGIMGQDSRWEIFFLSPRFEEEVKDSPPQKPNSSELLNSRRGASQPIFSLEISRSPLVIRWAHLGIIRRRWNSISMSANRTGTSAADCSRLARDRKSTRLNSSHMSI